jgi:ectoine hydroxylase-related dioxygenase (phytanoyl-CoA dioxygenase family)
LQSLKHLSGTSTAEAIADAIKTDGAVIVDDLIPASVIDRIATELAPWIDASPTGPDEFLGRRTKRTCALIARSVESRKLVMHPAILGAMALILSEATNFQLSVTQAIAISPGEPAQPVHRDQWQYDFYPFPKGFETVCSCMWAITDFTEENGATRVVPGSHTLDDGLPFTLEQTVPAEMGRGSALIWTGSVYHGGGANRSNATRIGVDISYALGWLRQEENQYLSVCREVASTLPVDLLRLMGYAKGAYSLGYIEEYRDPIAAVRPEAAESMSETEGKEAAKKAYGGSVVDAALGSHREQA